MREVSILRGSSVSLYFILFHFIYSISDSMFRFYKNNN